MPTDPPKQQDGKRKQMSKKVGIKYVKCHLLLLDTLCIFNVPKKGKILQSCPVKKKKKGATCFLPHTDCLSLKLSVSSDKAPAKTTTTSECIVRALVNRSCSKVIRGNVKQQSNINLRWA